ncbi:2EXR domain-containing protein [Fusarium sp. LHS14.1]|nr:2EXR domain-containing protein [Fusarium sp. LHS14.1]
MSDTFHLFSQLPCELRELIWTFALRSRKPGVHVFGTDPRTMDDDDLTLHSDYARPFFVSQRGHRLTAPTPHPLPPTDATHEPSWTTNNPSSYLIDGGLWTACKESRAVMEQEYESKRWRAFTNGRKNDFEFKMRVYDFPGDSLPEEERMSAMGYFLNNGSPHYFTVLPEMDLFFLQASSREPDLNNLYGLDHGHGLWSPHVGLAGPKNVAIEFDPAWCARIETGERDEEGISKLLDEFTRTSILSSQINTIWIVDYSLKRRAKKSELQSRNPRREIFEGADRRFVEVAAGWHYDLTDIHDDFETDSSCLKFYKVIEHASRELQENPRVADETLFYGRAWCGVLACEPL